MKKFILLLTILALASIQFIVNGRTERKQIYKINIAVEGKGVAGVIVGKSTMDGIIKKFGNGYKLINHNKYSYQIKYKKLGLSFYSCQSDKNKKIFSIEMRSPYRVKTSKGIVLGKSTTEDVFSIYGEPNDIADYMYEYKGIDFRSDEKFYGDKAKFEAKSNSSSEKNYIITEINLYPFNFKLCDEK